MPTKTQPRDLMRRRGALATLTAAVALTAAACNVEPANISGTVTGRSMQLSGTTSTRHYDYYLTVAGHTFQVYFDTYNACPTGTSYPKCKN
jgi:hypothetical protein